MEKADEQLTQDSTVAIVSRLSSLQDDQEDDTGHCTILPSDVAPTEASKTQDDDLALMDGSTSEPVAYCRTTVKDFNVAVSIDGIEGAAEPGAAQQQALEPLEVVVDNTNADNTSLEKSAEEPAWGASGSTSLEVNDPTLDALLVCDWDCGDTVEENPCHLSPTDLVRSTDRSPQASSEVADDAHDVAPCVKPPFEGWTAPPFPTPRNRGEKKWLRGYLKGHLPAQRRAAKKINRQQ